MFYLTLDSRTAHMCMLHNVTSFVEVSGNRIEFIFALNQNMS